VPPDFMDELPFIALQYEGFGHFLDIVHSSKKVLGIDKVSYGRLHLVIDDFAGWISLIYHNEYNRKSSGLYALNKILSAHTDDHSFLLTAGAVFKEATSDGHILGTHHAMYCIIKFKNKSGNVSAIPYVEMTGYFAHLTKEVIMLDASVI
jgi:hypothetical protein